MSHQSKNSQKNNRRHKIIRRGHRWVGYSVLVFVLILSITGLILNHTEKLDLNQIIINNKVVSALYNQPAPKTPPTSFRHGRLWLSWLEGRLYLDGKFIARNNEPPLGFAHQKKLVVVGSKSHISLYLADGSAVETLDLSSLPGKVLAFGQSDNGDVLITTASGNYAADSDFIAWQKLPATVGFTPDHPLATPAKIRKKILQDFRGPGISLYRLILDLHSGRIFGFLGPYLMDLAAIGLIILGITGLIQRRRPTKDKQKRK